MLAGGGFEANAEWRTRYLGPGWDLAKVRGTRFNTGDGIRMALDVGAQPCGNWSGCHAVGWDRNAPEFGDLAVGDGFQKHSYPFGIMVNARGRAVRRRRRRLPQLHLRQVRPGDPEQPGQFAWQIFDAKVLHLLRDEYRIRAGHQGRAPTPSRSWSASSRASIAARRWRPIEAFNAAVGPTSPFDPNVKDGRGTHGARRPQVELGQHRSTRRRSRPTRSPAASPSPSAASRSTPTRGCSTPRASPIPGLYAAGEMVGGLFYFNYPGGTGLMNGAVFGKIAGGTAGARARGQNA